jgi:hypothetical protein
MIYWHYTNGTRLWRILLSRTLEPLGTPNRLRFEKRPMVWFTESPTWDLGASSMSEDPDAPPGSGASLVRLTAQQMHENLLGLYRIGVDDQQVPLLRWPELGKVAGMSQWAMDTLESLATEHGSASAGWAGTLEAVPATHWRYVQWGNASGKEWFPLDGELARLVVRGGLLWTRRDCRNRKMDIEIRARRAGVWLLRPILPGIFEKPVGFLEGIRRHEFPDSPLWGRVANELSGEVTLSDSAIHGHEHAKRVALFAEMLACEYGADPLAAVVAAYCHDCGRVNDDKDPEHGKRSWARCAAAVSQRFPTVPMEMLRTAIEEHPFGKISTEPLIAALWDADRIDLMRFGPNKLESRFFSNSRALKLASVLDGYDFWGTYSQCNELFWGRLPE